MSCSVSPDALARTLTPSSSEAPCSQKEPCPHSPGTASQGQDNKSGARSTDLSTLLTKKQSKNGIVSRDNSQSLCKPHGLGRIPRAVYLSPLVSLTLPPGKRVSQQLWGGWSPTQVSPPPTPRNHRDKCRGPHNTSVSNGTTWPGHWDTPGQVPNPILPFHTRAM